MHPASAAPQLDVRPLAPRERHPLIFSTLNKLEEGQALVLVNDHDPKLLYYTMQAELPGKFSWDYLEEGPGVWRVAITKRRRDPSHQCCGSCGGA